MRYHIDHQTTYRYASDVLHSHHLLHLMARPSAWQECVESSIDIAPGQHRRVDQVDAFGNPVTRIELAQPHRELSVHSRMLIDVYPRAMVPMEDTWPWEKVRSACVYNGTELDRDVLDACRFRNESQHVHLKHLFCVYTEGCFTAGRPILACASALCDQLYADLTYAPGETTISTSVTEVLQRKRGVCQDFAHLMIACLRSRGLPARYISGYLRTHTPVDAPAALVGGGATHAWVAVWCPPFGWVEFDPTNGGFVGTDHISLAWGRDFADVSPLRGVILGGAAHKLSVKVHVAAQEGAG
ncbi:MAG: transglutaminase family protein [Pseudomonadota bacterium]